MTESRVNFHICFQSFSSFPYTRVFALGCAGCSYSTCTIEECLIVYFWLNSLLFWLISLVWVQRKKYNYKGKVSCSRFIQSLMIEIRTKLGLLTSSSVFFNSTMLSPPLSQWLSFFFLIERVDFWMWLQILKAPSILSTLNLKECTWQFYISGQPPTPYFLLRMEEIA